MSRKNVTDAAVFVAVLASLPIAVALLFMLRAVFVIGLVAVLGAGLLAYALSPAFRDWFLALVEPLIQYRGLRLATNVGFHPAHSWARVDDEVLVGVDDLVQATLGPVDDVQLPDSGLHVERGQPLFRLRHGDRSIEVPSPVSGTVVSVNAELRGHPELINTAPFANGWVVRIHSENVRNEWKHLLHGRRAWTWFRSATDRVIGLLPDQDRDRTGNAVGAGQLYQRLDADAWRQINETMFSAPAAERDVANLR